MVKHSSRRMTILLVTTMLLLAACSGLAGEPEVVATLAAPAAPTAIPLPEQAPNIANGQRIYFQNCTDCHGFNGAGGGELVESGEVPRMPSFLESNYTQLQAPEDYYSLISEGRLENLMPPWAGSLTQQERWDVALYVYTLNYTPELLELGATFAPDSSGDFSLQSDAANAQQLSGDTNLSTEDALALAAYQRVQTLENFGESLSVDTAALALADDELPETTSVTIVIENGTANSTIPDELPVYIAYGTDEDGFQSLLATRREGSRFFVDDVPVDPSFEYVAVSIFNDIQFESELVRARDLLAGITLPVTLYERTEDSDVLSLEQIEIAIERELLVEDLGTGLVFTQRNTYRNDSDKIYWLIPPPTEDGRQSPAVSLLLELPPGSVFLMQGSGRYIISQESYLAVDTNPIYPGQHTTILTYFMPYSDGAIFDIPLRIGLDGTVSIYMQGVGLGIIGSDLELVSSDGNRANSEYRGEMQKAPDDSLQFEIFGTFDSTQGTSGQSAITSDNALATIFLIVGIVLVILSAALYVMQRGGDSLDSKISRLVKQIADLDEMHEAGHINHDLYQHQRAELKVALTALMAKSADDAVDG